MYVKVFKQTLDSSLMEASTDARLLFFYLLVMADDEGVVDMTPHALARRCNMDLEAVQRGLKELAEPDPMSRTPVKNGRRIIPLEGRSWGWTVVNLGKYREIRSEQDRRKHSRQEYQARYYQQRKAKADVAPTAPEDRDSTVENVESVEFQQPQHFQHDSTLSTNSTVERVENVENVESQHSQQVSTFSTPKNKNKNKNNNKKKKKKRESRARGGSSLRRPETSGSEGGESDICLSSPVTWVSPNVFRIIELSLIMSYHARTFLDRKLT